MGGTTEEEPPAEFCPEVAPQAQQWRGGVGVGGQGCGSCRLQAARS